MDKQQKIIIFSGIGVVLVLLGVLVWLLFFKNDDSAQTEPQPADMTLQLRADSLQNLVDQQRMDQMLSAVEELPIDVEGANLQPEQQEIVDKYNEARNKIETLVSELKAEQAKSAKQQKRSQAEIDAQRKKIAELEGQVEQLKGYCKDLLARLAELNEKYEEQVQINTQLTEENKALQQTVTSTSTRNEELTQKVNTAKRLILTNISLGAYKSNGKKEKKVQKAAKLGVHFTVTANNTAAPGMKDFYVIIKTPEGQTLTGAGSFSAEGTTLQATARRQIEYANEEVSASVYYDVNTTLTAGSYSVMIFCDGDCLARRSFTLK